MAYLGLNKQHTPSKKRTLTKAEQREQAIAECRQGRHRLTSTFRPGERLCTVCSLVFSCQICIHIHHLPPAQGNHVIPFSCAEHREAGVRA
jgi:hypothetical protein